MITFLTRMPPAFLKRVIFFITLSAAFTIFPRWELWAKPSPLVCSPRALGLVKKMPSLFTSQEYQEKKAGGGEFYRFFDEEVGSLDWPTVRHLDPDWSERMDNYLKALGRWAGPEFWQVPVRELQACMVTQEVGKVDPNKIYDAAYSDLLTYGDDYAGLVGDQSLRLLNQPDISLEPRNSTPFNSIALYRTPQGTQAILVFDGAFSRSDPAAADFTRIKSPLSLVMFAYCTSAGGGSCVYRFYQPDLSQQKLVEYPLFQKGPLKFSYIGFGMSQDEEGFSSPQIVKNGKLFPKVQNHPSIYRLEGHHYVSLTDAKFEKQFPACREKIKEGFQENEREPWSKIEACNTLEDNYLRCPLYNDVSYLFYQRQKKEKALEYAIKALGYCKGNEKEFKAAAYNYLKVTGKK